MTTTTHTPQATVGAIIDALTTPTTYRLDTGVHNAAETLAYEIFAEYGPTAGDGGEYTVSRLAATLTEAVIDEMCEDGGIWAERIPFTNDSLNLMWCDSATDVMASIRQHAHTILTRGYVYTHYYDLLPTS